MRAKRLSIILAIIIILSVITLPTLAYAYSYSSIQYTYGTDGMLNIRNAAGGGSVVCEVPNGTKVLVDTTVKKNGYVPVKIAFCANASLVGKNGWVYVNYLSSSSLSYSATYYTNGSDGKLNLRNAPVRSSIINTYPNGTEVKADLNQKYNGYIPVKVTSTGQIGWMYFSYLTSSNSNSGTITLKAITNVLNTFGYSKGRYWSYNSNVKGASNSYQASNYKANTSSSKKKGKTGKTGYLGYTFDGGSECYGFARFVGYKVTGVKPGEKGWVKLTSVNSIKQSGGLKIGDIIQTSNHTTMVYSISSRGVISVVECWGSSNNYININGYVNGSSSNGTLDQINKNLNIKYVYRYCG